LPVDKRRSSHDTSNMVPEQSPIESAATKQKLLTVTWPLIAIAGLMLSLCVASLSTLSTIRAFVNGEGLWSKAERQSIAECGISP
jgi:hypothetical protein